MNLHCEFVFHSLFQHPNNTASMLAAQRVLYFCFTVRLQIMARDVTTYWPTDLPLRLKIAQAIALMTSPALRKHRGRRPAALIILDFPVKLRSWAGLAIVKATGRHCPLRPHPSAQLGSADPWTISRAFVSIQAYHQGRKMQVTRPRKAIQSSERLMFSPGGCL